MTWPFHLTILPYALFKAPIAEYVASVKSGGALGTVSKQIAALAQTGLPCCTGQARLFVGETDPEEHWIICNSLGSGRGLDQILRQDSTFGAKMIPWVGVAACIPQSPGEEVLPSLRPLQGKAFCFLPLPVYTGLPVHINGFFELSSNRRDIW